MTDIPPVDLVNLYDIIETLCNGSVESYLADYPDGEQLAWFLDRHRNIVKNVLGQIELALTNALIPKVPYGTGLTVEGVGVVQVMGGKERKQFDQPRIMSNLAEAIFLADAVADGGEITMTVREAIEHAVRVMGEATGAGTVSFNSWRSTVAKRYGLKLDDYAAEIEPSPRSIVIR